MVIGLVKSALDTPTMMECLSCGESFREASINAAVFNDAYQLQGAICEACGRAGELDFRRQLQGTAERDRVDQPTYATWLETLNAEGYTALTPQAWSKAYRELKGWDVYNQEPNEVFPEGATLTAWFDSPPDAQDAERRENARFEPTSPPEVRAKLIKQYLGR